MSTASRRGLYSPYGRRPRGGSLLAIRRPPDGVFEPRALALPRQNSPLQSLKAYDLSDQPTAMNGTAPNTGTSVDATYLYDGNNKRVRSIDTVSGKTIYNVYDAAGRLVHVENATDGEETDYLHGMGQTLARIKNGVFTYLHPDHLGSPVLGTKGQGHPVGAIGDVDFNERYTPFGEALIDAAANDNQSGFTGHIKDKSTGLNYMQARYYDPNVGRFLSVDPVTFMDTGNPGMFNRYAYTWNDPVNLTDPDGRNPGIDRRADQASKLARARAARRGAAMRIFKKHLQHAKAATAKAHQALAEGDEATARTFTGTDKLEHFMANFETVEELDEGGAEIAESISNRKEMFDRAKHILTLGKKGNSAPESAEDQRFNVGGRKASEDGLTKTEAVAKATEMIRETNKEFVIPPEHDQ
ncbi:RHS repeat-associated core domain-containing protein [Hellea sp.]|nr:RHS repeat-associated core domain-containing protein [Hellea sp.]